MATTAPATAGLLCRKQFGSEHLELWIRNYTEGENSTISIERVLQNYSILLHISLNDYLRKIKNNWSIILGFAWGTELRAEL